LFLDNHIDDDLGQLHNYVLPPVTVVIVGDALLVGHSADIVVDQTPHEFLFIENVLDGHELLAGVSHLCYREICSNHAGQQQGQKS
jgi:hypothetical protein